MDKVRLTIDGRQVQVSAGSSILEAACSLGIYIPILCYHPDLPPAEDRPAAGIIFQGELKIENARPHEAGKGCGLCVVEVEGCDDLAGACATSVQEGMVIVTRNDRIIARRRENLVPILACHRHVCLTCAQQEG
jgi:formate dehydrogenase beta subunit